MTSLNKSKSEKSNSMKSPIYFRRVGSYSEVEKYFDFDYNPPKIPDDMTHEDFESEFDTAHDTLIRWLATVGVIGSAEGSDFYLDRNVDVRRAINVVCDKYSPEVISAVRRAQQELPANYVINLDSHPAYVSILPTGDVLGFSDVNSGLKILDSYGFPR
jgi:hypothetical protein